MDSQEHFPAVRIDNGFKSKMDAQAFLEKYSTGFETSVEVILTSTIHNTLQDRTLRNIWKHDTTSSLAKIGVNMLEAKDILLSEVRTKRNAALEELDKQYAITTRTGADTALLDAQRTELLNATDALKALDVNGDGIVTPEEALVILGV